MDAYGTDQGFTDWLASQGLQLPVDAPSVSVLRHIGSGYIDAAYEHALQCSHRTGGFNQLLAWPRTGHVMNRQTVPNDLIPQAWINASYRAAYLQATEPGWATGGVNPDRITKREKIDVIEREFFSAEDSKTTAVAAGMPADAVINGMVLPWLCSSERSLDNLFMVI